MEREVGGGIGMGNICISMADSCQCMTKTTTICKVISLQLIKKKKERKKKKKERKKKRFYNLRLKGKERPRDPENLITKKVLHSHANARRLCNPSQVK